MSRYRRPDKHFTACLEALSEKPRRRITPAQVLELVWGNSQCIKDRVGHCPLLIFDKQLADALNQFFWED
jgi:hypothetical protein